MTYTYHERLTDWVILQSGEEWLSPSDSHFSASQVADLIIKYNRDKTLGRLNVNKE